MTERTLPAGAQKLIALAENNGWQAHFKWRTNSSDETYVNVLVGRFTTPEETRAFREDAYWGDRWEFQATWHSRNAARPGGLRLFGRILGKTPQRPQTTQFTLSEIREIIAAYPVVAVGSDTTGEQT